MGFVQPHLSRALCCTRAFDSFHDTNMKGCFHDYTADSELPVSEMSSSTVCR